jgi:hypothetical protein
MYVAGLSWRKRADRPQAEGTTQRFNRWAYAYPQGGWASEIAVEKRRMRSKIRALGASESTVSPMRKRTIPPLLWLFLGRGD